MILLSIIVPVYNVGKYLEKCLDSLLNQDISKEDYEILIINDESTDNSLQIAESYKFKYPNIKIISQKNIGLGGTRNKGIRSSSGKYLCFVDSDDYINPNCLRHLLELTESEQLDAIRFNYQSVDENYKVIPKSNNMVHSNRYDNEIVNGGVFITEKLGWACFVVLFIFKADIIKGNSLYFNETIFYEDVEWLTKVMKHVNRIRSIDSEVYYYLRRSGSITKSVSPEKINRVILDKLYIIEYLKSSYSRSHDSRIKKWYKSMISLTIMSILGYTQKNLPHSKKEVISKIKVNLKLMGSYHFTLKQKRDFLIIKVSPALYCYLKKK